MKKKIFAAAMALCLMAGMGAYAQQPMQRMTPRGQATPEQMAERRTQMMTKQLDLSEAQAKEIYDLNLEQIKQMKADPQAGPERRKAWTEKMNKVLTPEQQQTWKQAQMQRRANMRRPGGGGAQGRGGRVDENAERMYGPAKEGMSDDQKENSGKGNKYGHSKDKKDKKAKKEKNK